METAAQLLEQMPKKKIPEPIKKPPLWRTKRKKLRQRLLRKNLFGEDEIELDWICDEPYYEAPMDPDELIDEDNPHEL